MKMRGAAVWNFTFLFLEMWAGVWGGEDDLSSYVPTIAASADGFVQPFGDGPMDDDCITEDVYVQMIANAKRYVWITTPYLIPDDKLSDALCMASESGIDVRIVTPNYPDKKQVHEVTRSNYELLLRSGVRIFEFTPGFVHSKMFISDDERAIVGTTNLDYRSFFLHFELSVAFYGSSIIKDVKSDFNKIFDLSKEMESGAADKISPIRKVFRYFYKLFSPAL